jgi:hypothetical protein
MIFILVYPGLYGKFYPEINEVKRVLFRRLQALQKQFIL